MKPATTGERIVWNDVPEGDTDTLEFCRQCTNPEYVNERAIAAAIDAAIAAEREACAEVAHEYGAGWFDSRTFAAQEIAAAIRARGNPTTTQTR